MNDKAIAEIRKRRDEARLIAHEMDALLDLIGANDLAPTDDDNNDDDPNKGGGAELPEDGGGDEEHEDEPDPPRGKAAAPSANGHATGKLSLVERIAVTLSDNGPLKRVALAELLGKTDANVGITMKQRAEWFEKQDAANRMSPWRLTEAGQVAANALPR